MTVVELSTTASMMKTSWSWCLPSSARGVRRILRGVGREQGVGRYASYPVRGRSAGPMHTRVWKSRTLDVRYITPFDLDAGVGWG